ncbi:MAG: amidohydrolase family protein [Proteobacteria bacterium]|nr:amidohydrolase family protein [Pseudomonadota bacterium]
MLAVLAAVLGCGGVTSPDSPRVEKPSSVRALVGATLIDGTGAAPIADAVVVIDGARIACAGSRSACPVPGEAKAIDVSGHWITPGLVDTHVHFSQTAWVDGRPDFIDARDRYPYDKVHAELRRNPERYYRAFLCSGVTAVFDVGGYPWTWDLRQVAENDPGAPHIAAAGPLVTHADHRLIRIHPPAEMQFIALTDPEAGRRAVRYLHANSTDAVKIWFLTPKPGQDDAIEARVRAVGDEAGKLGVPLIVHATYLRLAKVSIEAGASLLVHDVRDPIDDAFIELLKDRGTIYTPTLVVSYGYQRIREAAVTGNEPAIDDPHGCVDADTLAKIRASTTLRGKLRQPADGKSLEQDIAVRSTAMTELHKVMYDNLRRVYESGALIAMGTDAGNPATLHGPSVYAQMEAMQAAGMPAMAVLVASTQNGAKAMGREADFGTVAAGKIADLLVVAADPGVDIKNMRQLKRVWRAGVEIISRP